MPPFRNGSAPSDGRQISPDRDLAFAGSQSGESSVDRGDHSIQFFQFLLNQPVTSAGRHPDSDIFLDDATVSRHHVEFRLENGQFLLVDLDSLNNTSVNHEPIDSAVLVNGDEIQIGKFRLVFLTRPTTG